MKRSLTGVVLLAAACGGDAGDTALSIREALRGDTAVIISSGDPPLFAAGAVQVTWQDDELGNPQTMARVGDHLVLGDGFRIHLLSAEGGHIRTFGARGEGPGELQSISAVGGFGADTIAVHDARLQRVSLYSLEGRYLTSWLAVPTPEFVNPSRAGPPLVRDGSGVLWTRTTNVMPGSPIRLALIRHDLDAGAGEVVEAWDDVTLQELPSGIFGTRELFPLRAIVAVEQDGRFVEGNGREYCLRVRRMGSPQVALWCRETPRVGVGPGLRSPDLGLLEGDAQADLFRGIIGAMDPGEFLPHFDELHFGESGELWVRTLGEAHADLHPTILARRPDLAPTWRIWEVFNMDGALVRRVQLPHAFTPRVFFPDRVFGFWPLETGEVTIAQVRVEEVG